MKQPMKYTCLFGGGAIRGMSYIGVIKAFEELEIELNMLGGASVGAVFASLLACGYTSSELQDIFMDVNFELFKDIRFGFTKSIGLSKGEIFVEWLNELISNKLKLNDNAVFSNLQKNLVIMTTNLNKFCCQEFSQFETPNFEIAKAVRISASMPGLMPPFEYNGAPLADGDLLKAVPMWQLSQNVTKSSAKILEFRLEGECNPSADHKPLSFINTIYSCFTGASTDFISDIYGKNDKFDYIKINTGNTFFADLNVNKDTRLHLIKNGYQQTMNYFQEVLPLKKQNISKIYLQINKFLKKIGNELTNNNIENINRYFGQLFILLYKNKEVINPILSDKIQKLQELFSASESKLFFIYPKYKNIANLKQNLDATIDLLQERISDNI